MRLTRLEALRLRGILRSIELPLEELLVEEMYLRQRLEQVGRRIEALVEEYPGLHAIFGHEGEGFTSLIFVDKLHIALSSQWRWDGWQRER